MSKGQQTREAILTHAHVLASGVGLQGLSIGRLAGDLGLSKSGLFAHFGSMEALQLAVLEAAAARFVDQVLRPALDRPTGIERLETVFNNWLAWAAASTSKRHGCLLVAAAAELDDQDGAARDYLVAMQRDWLGSLARIADKAVREGTLDAALDRAQFAHELQSILLGYHFAKRLFRDEQAEQRARTAFARLLASAAPRAS